MTENTEQSAGDRQSNMTWWFDYMIIIRQILYMYDVTLADKPASHLVQVRIAC